MSPIVVIGSTDCIELVWVLVLNRLFTYFLADLYTIKKVNIAARFGVMKVTDIL